MNLDSGELLPTVIAMELTILYPAKGAGDPKDPSYIMHYKPTRWTAEDPAIEGNCLIIQLDLEIPTVVAVYASINYRFYEGMLPETFLDHKGNLRNQYGKGLLPAKGNPSNLFEEKHTASDGPYHVDYNVWTGTTSATATWAPGAIIGQKAVNYASSSYLIAGDVSEGTTHKSVAQKLKSMVGL